MSQSTQDSSHATNFDSRMRAAQDGDALPDGSHPVRNCDELRREIKAAESEPVLRRYFIRQAIKHGCVDDIPDEWTVSTHGGRQNNEDGQQGKQG